MRASSLLLVPLLLCPAFASAEGDIAEAVRFALPIMTHDLQGFEDFVDSDPDEALSLLLSRDVQPGRAPEDYLEDDGMAVRPSDRVLDTLGDVRLNFEALREIINEAAAQTGLPAGLIDAVIRTESGYRPRAVSHVGARGLMQLMPGTAREVGVVDPFDPRQNVMGGARYLRKMYDMFGNLRMAVAAYNAGPGAVQKHGKVPPYRETLRYVDTVLSRYAGSRYLGK